MESNAEGLNIHVPKTSAWIVFSRRKSVTQELQRSAKMGPLCPRSFLPSPLHFWATIDTFWGICKSCRYRKKRGATKSVLHQIPNASGICSCHCINSFKNPSQGCELIIIKWLYNIFSVLTRPSCRNLLEKL